MSTLETTNSGGETGAGAAGGASGIGAAAWLEGGAGTTGGAGETAGAGEEVISQYPEWVSVFSDKPLEDGGPSARDWVAKKGFKDLDGLAKAARDTERAYHLAVPNANDPEEKWMAHFQKLGRPETPDGYEVKAPDGFEANPEFTGRFKETMHKAGILPRQAALLTEWYNGEAISGMQAAEQARGQQEREQRAALQREWGSQFDANIVVSRRGMQLLGLDGEMLNGIGSAIGHDQAVKLMHKIGAMTSEDMLRGGNMGGQAGFTLSVPEAQQQLMEFSKNPENVRLIRAGDEKAKQAQARLINQLAAAKDAMKRGG